MRDDQAQQHHDRVVRDRNSGMARPGPAVGADPFAEVGPHANTAPVDPWLLRQASHGDPVCPSSAHPAAAKWSRRRALALIVGTSALLWALLLSGWHAL